MSKVNDIMRKDILYYDFIHAEIVKRHIEEYHPRIIYCLKKIKNELCKNTEEEYRDLTFLVTVGQLVSLFEVTPEKDLNFKYLEHFAFFTEHSDLCDLRDPKIEYMYVLMASISYKYDIVAPEILYPIDMTDVIEKYNDKFYPPTTYKFITDEENDKFQISYPNKKLTVFPNILHYICNNKEYNINENDVDYLKNQFLLDKIVKGEKIDTNEKDFINHYEGNLRTKKFRQDSFIRYIIGLLSWDYDKDYNNGDDINKIYYNYQNKYNICEGYKCYGNKNCLCDRKETCDKFVRDAKRIVSLSIEKCNVVPIKTNGSTIGPQRKILLRRYPLDFFTTNL